MCLMEYVDVQWQQHCNMGPTGKLKLTLVFMSVKISPIEINCQLIKVYTDGIMRVVHVKNLCTDLKIGGKDICSDDQTSGPACLRMDVNAS